MKVQQNPRRRMHFGWFFLIAAALITAISGFGFAGDNLFQIQFGNNSKIYITNDTSELNGTVLVNGSAVCTVSSGCPGATDNNNYPTSLSVNQTSNSYSIVMPRNGLGTLIANFSVSASGGGAGNLTIDNNITGWPLTAYNATHITNYLSSCSAGYALQQISNNSVCVQVVTPSDLTSYLTIVSAAATYVTQTTFNTQNTTNYDTFYLKSNPDGYYNTTTLPHFGNSNYTGLVTLPFANLTGVPGFGFSNITSVVSNNLTDFNTTTTNGNVFQINTTGGNFRAGIGNNSITLACENITGAASNLCTITGGSGSPGGSIGNVQFNNGGLGASSNFTYDNVTSRLNVSGNITTDNLTVNSNISTELIIQNGYAFADVFQTRNYKCEESELGGAIAAGNAQMNAPFHVTAVSSGTFSATTSGGNDHRRVTMIQDSTTANGGGYIGDSLVTAGDHSISAGDDGRAILETLSGKGGTAPARIEARIGFMDTQTAAAGTDGCYIVFNSTQTNGNTAYLQCVAAGAVTTNATTFTFTNATWYGARVRHLTTTSVNATIYDDTGAIQWEAGLTSGVYSAPTNFQIIATENTTSAAANIVGVDYLGYCTKYKPNRGWPENT